MRTRTRTAIILAASLALLGACKNKQHCEGNPHDDCRLDDAQPSCSASDQCAAPTPVCDPQAMACVQCTPAEAGACTGATPVCGEDNQCRACSAHAECPTSNACLPEGRCADPGEVAYVQLNGTGGQPCAKAAPCGTLQEGVTAASASRPYVRILGAGTLTPGATTTIDGKTVTILAEPGAKLDRMGDGVNLEVRNTGADVRIYDLEITGASGGASDVGIFTAGGTPKLTLTRVKVTNNIGGGISMTGGTLTVLQSTISGNQGGGISISNAEFDLSNNFIAKNGSAGSIFGGVRIDGITAGGMRRFEFNTVTDNNGPTSATTGVVCTLVMQPLVFSNNIVYDNQVGGGRTQVGGMNCSWTYSDIGPDTVAGMGNINMNPMFKDLAQSDYHLQSGSPAKDAADAAASLAIDIDGDPRPQGTRRDMGADEIR